MRKCHLNTCPVGIATQDAELRKRFSGKPDHVVNFFMFIAEEVRRLMAEMGFRTFNEMIGRTDMLDARRAVGHWKAKGLDLSRVLHRVEAAPGVAVYNSESQDHGLDKALDNQLIDQARQAIEEGKPVTIEMPIRNINRTFATMLSHQIAKRYGHDGLAEDTIYIKCKGTAGQSLGAFLSRGITIELEGDANDYVGKGLSGGRIVVYPPRESPIKAEKNIIIGNTVLYGAIAGECYFRGIAGERFAVRNSGAAAVIEGIGDHGCEYMTGGVAVVLGPTGRNFAAGMSGGIAYVLNVGRDFERRCNTSMVSLEPIEEEETVPANLSADELFKDMLRYDEGRLKGLIEKHLHYTNSERARLILENWQDYLPKFVKVMPIDFQKALERAQRHARRPDRRSDIRRRGKE